MLPYIPESIDHARTRFAAATDPLFDLGDPRCPAAGASRTHVFDFEDGIRLIISREKHPACTSIARHCCGVCLHLSASVDTSRRVPSVGLDFLFKAESRFREIADWPDAPLSLLGLSPEKHVPHWIIPESDFRHRAFVPTLSHP